VGARAAANANTCSGSNAIIVPSARIPNPTQIQFSRLVLQIEPGHHYVEVLPGAPPDCDLGDRLLLVLPVIPAAGVCLVYLLAVLEHRHVRRDHLLLAIVGDTNPVVADDVLADLRLLARLQQDLLVHLERLPGKTEEHQDDAQVDYVTTVTPLRPPHEADQRGEVIGAGCRAAHPRAANELLQDRDADEGAERKAKPRRPDRNP
jgi:hypothetical protein